MKRKTSLLTVVLAGVAALVLQWAGLLEGPQQRPPAPVQAPSTAPAAEARTQAPAAGEIAFSALPGEARQVIRLIHAGGPFPYEKDGTVFQNRERLLPARDRGYYREYTVATPGEASRGARRIVAGGPPRDPEVIYYTADHYRSFRRVRGEAP